MLLLILSIGYLMIYTLADAMSDAWIFLDFRRKSKENDIKIYAGNVPFADSHDPLNVIVNTLNANKKWHQWQLVRQASAIVFAALMSKYWSLLLFGAAFFWLIHDGIVNVVGLSQKWFYVGETAAIDKFFRETFGNPVLAMAVAKILALALGVTWFVLDVWVWK